MDCYVGIDLGSTTTKAVFLDSSERILGRGITNSRSNYTVACQVAREEAEISARFNLLKQRLASVPRLGERADELMAWLSCKFALAQHLKQLKVLQQQCQDVLARTGVKGGEDRAPYEQALVQIFEALVSTSEALFAPNQRSQSDFFRDLATSLYLKEAEKVARASGLSFDRTVGIFDKAILQVENTSFATFFAEYLAFACRETVKVEQFKRFEQDISQAVREVTELKFNVLSEVGTGYGRLTLPFPKEQIRSEILCHGLGAHYMFPKTRTVLDIGGQDTKSIQVDESGIVTSFQMNDRCAAGCGRYLGYIADEMNMGVHQLGPLAAQSKNPVRINSTCTVFAGAELRERLSLGEKREDILAGLHRAIILRAMSILARSGGVFSEFTFTGGVARNEAAVAALKELLKENYGDVPMNISPDSIFTGATGAALFARRDSKKAEA
ncbi:MAG: benzoyl-CoA reductase subunit A [Myxococcales bacterium]|nr:benzoyl-CoA reductase subunit A [Myxococcales bacterium]